MKKSTLDKVKMAALPVLAGALLAGTAAHADTVSAAAPDLILAFRVNDGTGAGGSTNLEINLGTAADLVSEAALQPGGVLTLSNSSGLAVADLRTIYGDGTTDSSWNTRTDLVWSVVGADGSHDLWVTAPGDLHTPNAASFSSQSGPAGKINALYGSVSGSSTANSSEAVSVPSAQGNSYSTEIRNGNPGTFTKDYNYFATANKTESGVPSSGDTTADLFYLPAGGTSSDLGTFSLDSAGDFTFTTASVSVPEPANWVAMALGAGGIALIWRRKTLAPSGEGASTN